jgi:hypothetical protein
MNTNFLKMLRKKVKKSSFLRRFVNTHPEPEKCLKIPEGPPEAFPTDEPSTQSYETFRPHKLNFSEIS